MSPATETRPYDRVIDSFLDRQASVFDAFRSGNDRNHRFARSVLEVTRQNTRDWFEVNRRFLSNPRDLVGVYEAASDAYRRLTVARSSADARVDRRRRGDAAREPRGPAPGPRRRARSRRARARERARPPEPRAVGAPRQRQGQGRRDALEVATN